MDINEQSSTATSFLYRMSHAPRETDTGGVLSDANWQNGAEARAQSPQCNLFRRQQTTEDGRTSGST